MGKFHYIYQQLFFTCEQLCISPSSLSLELSSQLSLVPLSAITRSTLHAFSTFLTFLCSLFTTFLADCAMALICVCISLRLNDFGHFGQTPMALKGQHTSSSGQTVSWCTRFSWKGISAPQLFWHGTGRSLHDVVCVTEAANGWGTWQ